MKVTESAIYRLLVVMKKEDEEDVMPLADISIAAESSKMFLEVIENHFELGNDKLGFTEDEHKTFFDKKEPIISKKRFKYDDFNDMVRRYVPTMDQIYKALDNKYEDGYMSIVFAVSPILIATDFSLGTNWGHSKNYAHIPVFVFIV
jgi:hypothetical protein